MRIRWGTVILVTIVLGVIVLVGCARPRPEEKGREKVVIRFENWEVTPEQLGLWKEVVDKFNKQSQRVKVVFQAVQGGPEKILVEIAGGTAPDVFYWHTHLLSPLARKKAVVDLTPFIKKDGFNLNIYFDHLIRECKYEDKIFGLPTYWGNMAIAYNKDLFDKAGIAYPSSDLTWEEFLEKAEQLTIMKDSRIIQYGTTVPHPLFTVISFGGRFFDEKGERCYLNSPQVKEALTFLKTLVDSKIAPLPESSVGLGREELKLFMTGKVAMSPVAAWQLPVLRKIKDFKWDVAPFPRKKGYKRRTFAGTGVLCISSQSKYIKEAWEFVKFAAGREGSEVLGKGRNSIPAIKEIADRVFSIPPPDNIRVFIDSIEEFVPYPKFRWFRKWKDLVLKPAMDDMFIQKRSVAETMKTILSNTEEYLKKRKREKK